MSLPVPQLDTLRYDQLLAEARDLLPYRAPTWTDHNAHDPGITLLELFAWQAETGSYRLDRIPSASERAFLRLVGNEVQPAQVARTVVAFRADSNTSLTDGVQIRTVVGKTRFQTSTSFDVAATRITTLLSSTASGIVAHDVDAASFHPFGVRPAPGDALYIGFDRALPAANARVRLFALTDDPAGDELTWRALYAEHRRQRRASSSGCRRSQACQSIFWQHHGVRVAWEYFNGTTWNALPGLRDATRALSLSGPVRFRSPSDMHAGGVTGYDTTLFIRCRIICGTFDCAPHLTALLLNAVLARHAADNPPRTLGVSTGQAQQRFDVSDEPLVPGSVQITLTLPNATQSLWQERANFDRSGPLAQHVVIDTARGQAVFGDGLAGQVPPAAASLSARWRTGSGLLGNLPAKSLALVIGHSGLSVKQPVTAWGGSDAETLGAAKARAVRSIALARCAVTLPDFEAAALHVPGAPVVRCKAIAEFHPQLRHMTAAGCITLVIVSPCVRNHPNPTPALCRAVRRFLDGRRPVATELHVTGPVWTKVSVKATLRTQRGANGAALRAKALHSVTTFFDPLLGGPEGHGWPFGRPVFRTEVLALLNAMPGVVAVEQLRLASNDGGDDLCNNIALCPHGLVLSGTHTFNVSTESTP